MTFSKVESRWNMALVAFADAGHGSRPSWHSQAGALIYSAPKKIPNGKQAGNAILATHASVKLGRAVWSSYASQLQAAAIAFDSAVSVLLLYDEILWASKAKEVKARLTDGSTPRVLVADIKGLYDAVLIEKASTRQAVKMQSFGVSALA